jgi:hypothetical protein
MYIVNAAKDHLSAETKKTKKKQTTNQIFSMVDTFGRGREQGHHLRNK